MARHTRAGNPITVVTLNSERDSVVTAAQNANTSRFFEVASQVETQEDVLATPRSVAQFESQLRLRSALAPVVHAARRDVSVAEPFLYFRKVCRIVESVGHSRGTRNCAQAIVCIETCYDGLA